MINRTPESPQGREELPTMSPTWPWPLKGVQRFFWKVTDAQSANINNQREIGTRRFKEGQVAGVKLAADTFAHELRTDLQLVTGYGSLLLTKPAIKSAPELSDLISRMIDGAETGARKISLAQRLQNLVIKDAGNGPVIDLDGNSQPPVKK